MPLTMKMLGKTTCWKECRNMPKPTEKQILAAIERDDNTGFCLACGNEQHGCEPDMERGVCENPDCREHRVYGAEQLLITGLYRA